MKSKFASASMLTVHVAPHSSHLSIAIPHTLEVSPIESARLQTPWDASTAQNGASHVVLLPSLH